MKRSPPWATLTRAGAGAGGQATRRRASGALQRARFSCLPPTPPSAVFSVHRARATMFSPSPSVIGHDSRMGTGSVKEKFLSFLESRVSRNLGSKVLMPPHSALQYGVTIGTTREREREREESSEERADPRRRARLLLGGHGRRRWWPTGMAVAEAGTATERGRRRCFCPRRFCMTMTRWRASGALRSAPLLYHFKISSGETRDGESRAVDHESRPTVVLDGRGRTRLLPL